MGRKSRESLGHGGKRALKVKNSQYRSRKLNQSQSKQDVLEKTEVEYSEVSPGLRGVQNLIRKGMRK